MNSIKPPHHFKSDSIIQMADLFYQGKYKEALKLYSELADLTLDHHVLAIGSLAFSGEVQKAIILFKSEDAQWTPSQKSECHFYLSVGCARLSKYTEAKTHLQQLIQLRNKLTQSQDRFFLFQGLGFFCYINGKLPATVRWAERSQQNAFLARFLFGQVLSTDLLGHSNIKIGEISKGLTLLREAKDFATQLGQFGTVDAIEISLTIYHSKYQWSFSRAQKNLNKMLEKLKTEDNYSKANLLIELAEAFKKAGKLQKSYELLSDVAMIIYSHQNYRQEALLNLKFAHLNQLRGKFREALSILVSAKRILKPDVDNILLLEFYGLEKQILFALGEQRAAEQVQKQLDHLTKVTGDYLNRRIELRRQGRATSWRVGEDLMGDILDEVDRKIAIQKTLDSGYFGLLPTLLGIENKSGYIIFDLEPNSLTICRSGETYHNNLGLTPISRKLLFLLSDNKPHGKEDILKAIWGYDYNPIVHDPMIYGHLSRLRKQFGPFKSALMIRENGYVLSSHFQLYNGLLNQPDIPLSNEKTLELTPSITPLPSLNNNYSLIPTEGLNYRQIQILQWLQKNPFIDIQIHQRIFKASPITATRDLAELTQKNLLKRIGRARATKYTLFKEFTPIDEASISL